MVGLIDLRCGGETLDDIPHDRKAFSIIPRFVKAAPGVQHGIGAKGVVFVFLGGGGLVMQPRFVEILGLL